MPDRYGEPRQDPDEPNTTRTTTRGIYDLPDYPPEWTPDQRLTAYWHHIRTRTARPTTTNNWRTLLRQAESRPRHTTPP